MPKHQPKLCPPGNEGGCSCQCPRCDGQGHPTTVTKTENSAMLVTRYLPESMKNNLAWGLHARYNELWRDRGAGYDADNTKRQRKQLMEDARQAYALGLTSFIPPFKEDF